MKAMNDSMDPLSDETIQPLSTDPGDDTMNSEDVTKVMKSSDLEHSNTNTLNDSGDSPSDYEINSLSRDPDGGISNSNDITKVIHASDLTRNGVLGGACPILTPTETSMTSQPRDPSEDTHHENKTEIATNAEDPALLEFQSRLSASRLTESTKKMNVAASSDGSLSNAGGSGKSKGSDEPPGSKGKKVKKKHYIIQRTFLALFVIFFMACLGAGAFVWGAVKETPTWTPEKLENHKYASIVYDKNGNKIAQLSADENRLPIRYEDLPEFLKQSLLAVEDKRFYDHLGFDPVRIAKGAINTLRNPDQPEGGSTLTVQLAKSTFISFEDSQVQSGTKGIKRKIQEIVLSLQIERNYSKEEILTTYLTQIFYGHGAYGVRSAALIYFGKEDLNDLTIPEVAMLCGLPQAPGLYDPYLFPEKAQVRRDLVLSIMRDDGLITVEQYEQYKDEPFTFIEDVQKNTDPLNLGPGQEKIYPYFVDYVVKCLLDKNMYNLDYGQIYHGGLHIRTTVDPVIQLAAEETMRDPDNFPPNAKDGKAVQGAIVMLDNGTGDVVAMVGGREYTNQLGYNRASEGKRQVGSTAKPLIVYAPALEHGGFDANTVEVDEPISIGGWSPKNSSGGYSGAITMRQAVRNSVNIFAVKIYQLAGPEYCWNFAKNMGLDLTGSHYSYLSNALGGFEATPLEMALAYAAFPNGGMRNEPRCVTEITDLKGKVILAPQPQSRRVMKEMTAYAMDDMLHGVVTGGTGTRAQIGNWYLSGKTGTTNMDASKYGVRTGNPDAWFLGYSPKYTAAVWIGFDVTDEDHYLFMQYGGSKPAMIWKQVMSKALEGMPVQSTSNWQSAGVRIPLRPSIWPEPEPEPDDTKPATDPKPDSGGNSGNNSNGGSNGDHDDGSTGGD